MKKTKGLKYHKFLKNFFLFFLAVYNSIFAALYFSGAMYSLMGERNVDADFMYSFYGKGLKTLDIVYACLLCIGAIVALIVRYRLSNGFKDGVYAAVGLFTYQGIMPFVYSVWGHIISKKVSVINFKDVIFLCIYAGIAFLTFKYYKKREELFKN